MMRSASASPDDRKVMVKFSTFLCRVLYRSRFRLLFLSFSPLTFRLSCVFSPVCYYFCSPDCKLDSRICTTSGSVKQCPLCGRISVDGVLYVQAAKLKYCDVRAKWLGIKMLPR